jgi:abequosyltransferase
MTEPFLSICIPSYNRPDQLSELLCSVDCNPAGVEILICEDLSPRRAEVRAAVEALRGTLPYFLRYEENPKNFGFDGNIRRIVSRARGKFILFMGDDDLFLPGALDPYIAFLHRHEDKGYVLRSYVTEHADGTVEEFRYLPNVQEFPAGADSVAWLFKRSVSLCGFTIARATLQDFRTEALDGTLLYQVYLMAQVCLRQPSVYCNIPVGHAVQSFRKDNQMFGNSKAERSRFTPGAVSVENSINFSLAYFEVTRHLDAVNGTALTEAVRKDLSRYSYPFLSIQRKRGIRPFLAYARRLERELGFGITPYFHIYKWALILLGERLCDKAIVALKRLIGHTPRLR